MNVLKKKGLRLTVSSGSVINSVKTFALKVSELNLLTVCISR